MPTRTHVAICRELRARAVLELEVVLGWLSFGLRSEDHLLVTLLGAHVGFPHLFVCAIVGNWVWWVLGQRRGGLKGLGEVWPEFGPNLLHSSLGRHPPPVCISWSNPP